jgi:small subunit ribosomal protein S1
MAERMLDHEEYYNSFRTGAFTERTDDGFLFQVDDLEVLVPEDDLPDDASFDEGEEAQLLVERPYGRRWAGSVSKVECLQLWDRLARLAENEGEVEGMIVAQNKGGLSVDMGVRAFVPRSQIDIHRVDDCSPYVGRTERFRVIEFDAKRCNVVLSRRALLEEEREEDRSKLLQTLEAGQVYDGVVRNVVDYGAFVDVGGVEGLLHSSNISWGRVDHPSELFRPGDEVKVVVLDWDPDRERLSLGRKQLLADPWKEIDADYSEGDVVEGKVVSLAEFGAFVEVEPGLEGLVHVTELSWVERIEHPREVLEIGQHVRVKVIGIDSEKRRLSLSVKRLEKNPWEKVADDFPAGTKLEGRITNVVDFGLFVEVVPGVEGLVHVSDLSWTEKIDDPAEHYAVGDTVEVVVLEVDVDAGRVSLGVKQLTDDPWDEAAEVAKVGEKIDVEITRVVEFGAFAEIVPGVEGLIHISELSEQRVNSAAEVVRPGQTVEALVMSFERGKQRIGLSMKRDELDGGDIREYQDEGSTTALGDVLRSRLGLAGQEE